LKTFTSLVFVLLSLFSFGQNCDCNTINIPPECRKKCGPLIISKGSEKQVEALAPNLPKPAIKKVINAPGRANKTSPKDFKNDLTPSELSIFENEYNNWSTNINNTTIVSSIDGVAIGTMTGGQITINPTVREEPKPVENQLSYLKMTSGNWVGSFDVNSQPDGYSMVMEVRVNQDRIHGSIKLNWKKNPYTYAVFSFSGVVKNDTVTIDENTVTDVYGVRTWWIKQYIGTLSMDGRKLKLSGTWNNDSHRLYDWGRLIITGEDCPGGYFELTKL